MSESDDAVGAIFDGALQQPPGQRAAYVRGACAGDRVLQERVEALLLALESAGGFMEGPAVAPPPGDAPSMDAEPGNPPSAPGEPMAQAPADEAVGQTVGRYKLLEKIGEGGCGVVYLAEQKEPVRRHVALKVIKLGMDTRQVILRFEAERQALALMDHPNIARVLDGGASEAGRPYFVMELVRGIPMTQYCEQTRLSTRQRLELFIPVCQAIQHAHQKGIVHRDIKPSNILVTLHDGVPVPKVIDFGIAKAIEGRLTDGTVYTQLHQFMGTPAYMSPEQAELTGLDIDTRSDIYSLGVLLYELLAGGTPFDAKELMAAGLDAMRQIIREQEPMRPSTRLMQIQWGREGTPFALRQSPLPTDLDWIVMKCLEKDRTRRYETANGLAFDLKRHLNDEPVLARPPSAAYRLQKAFRRHRLTFTAAIVVALAMVGGIGVSTFQTVVARKAQRETEAARESERKANEGLRFQVGETEKAKRSAEAALQLMQTRKAEELFEARQSALAVGYLGNVLRTNPSNDVAGARLASAMLRPFGKEMIEPLRHTGEVYSAEFSPDGLRVLTASRDHSARVWDARSGLPLTEPLLHEHFVLSARFSPDGSRVVTASMDGTARIWDAGTGRQATAPLRHERVVVSAEYSPDGLQVVTAGDNAAQVWDARTGQPMIKPLRHESGLYAAQFSPDGLRVATASADQTARVWDARTGESVTGPLRHDGGVVSVQFSRDGLRLVTASLGGSARVWDASTGQPLTEPLRHGGPVRSARFSPDGLRVVTASDDSTARVWDARTGGLVFSILGHTAPVVSAEFRPDGLRIVTASDDGTVRGWDAHTGEPATEPLRHDREVRSVRFSPDGSRVVTGCADKSARVWDAQPGQPLVHSLRHGGPVRLAEFSPDGMRVVTASQDNPAARVWDARTGEFLTELLGHTVGVVSAQFSLDGLQVVTASPEDVRVWDTRAGHQVTGPFRRQLGAVLSAQFGARGLQVVTGSLDHEAQVWDASSGQPMTGPIPHEGFIQSARFSVDGGRVVTACKSWARVWNVRGGEPMTGPLKHDDQVVSAMFSPDGSRLVTASEDQTARVWDIETGQPISKALQHEGPVRSALFSPDGLRVVTASDDRTARIWDARTGEPLTDPLRHGGAVSSALFSPDGSRVVTASADNTARVWDTRTGQTVGDPLWHEGPVRSARFSPDGYWLVTASADGTARVWNVEPPPLPVPAWFLDWAEVRVARRFVAREGTEGIPFAEQQSQRERVRSRTDTDFYTRLAQWVEADPATRASSPHALPRATSSTLPDSAP